MEKEKAEKAKLNLNVTQGIGRMPPKSMRDEISWSSCGCLEELLDNFILVPSLIVKS